MDENKSKHGNNGNRHASKPEAERKTSYLRIALKPGEKATFVMAAGGRTLTAYVLEAIYEKIERDNQPI